MVLSPPADAPSQSTLSATNAAEDQSQLVNEDTDPANEGVDQLQDSLPTEGLEAMVTEAGMVWGIVIGIAFSFLVALVVTLVSSVVMQQIFRRSSEVRRAILRTRLPLVVTLTAIGTRLSVGFVAGAQFWFAPVAFLLVVVIVIGIAWLALRLVRVAEAIVLANYAGEGDLEDRRGRRLQTQVALVRRILAALIITLAVAAVLLSFEQVRALGVGMLASAGVASVVAGLAMQSTLTNLFAGLQLAFTDAVRVGDVVIADEIYGVIEDITLTVVVLKTWDDRRVIFPSSYFVAIPFENWTRVGTALLGTVELELDWRVPMDEMRARMRRLVESTDLWDGRECSMQVTEANAGMIKAWAVVSAGNAGALWDLRCLVREDFVNFLRTEHPYAVATQRMLISQQEPEAPRMERAATGQFGVVGTEAAEDADPDQGAAADAPLTTAGEGTSIFTGSIAAVERNRDFAGPGEDVYQQRRDRQEDGAGAQTGASEDAEDAEDSEVAQGRGGSEAPDAGR